MGIFRINTFFNPDQPDFDSVKVLKQLIEVFATTKVEPEDPFVVYARRLEIKLAESGIDNSIVLEKAWRNVREMGPAFVFTIEENKGEFIKGRIERYLVQFEFENSLSDKTRKRLCNFLNSLKAGEISFLDIEPVWWNKKVAPEPDR